MSDTVDLPPKLRAAAEIAFNRYLSNDPNALARCRRLTGRTLAVRVNDWDLAICIMAVDHGIQLRPWRDETHYDVALTGAANAFAQLTRRADTGAGAIGASGLNIEGDIGVAQGFAELARTIDVEAADLVESITGPVTASVFDRGWRAARGLVSRISQEVPSQLREYLLEETAAVASKAEVDDFAEQTARLRDEVDRLSARKHGSAGG
ncbi:hypothetical protein HKX42_08940 [Salinisphaera sp. USBA-960]|nr:hypothetical protein [Salifodinibacter halophilus]NNC26999.1 hypothetical protein [Salifodinibacter halophilus]